MIYVIAGPTGSGKTALALRLAGEIDGVIINGDAFQIYQEMDIGTAKPSKEERSLYPHYLFDFIPPTEEYNIYRYQEDLRKIISTETRPIIIVGGSGLYLRAALYDYTFAPLPKLDMSIYASLSDEELSAQLAKVDAVSATKIHPHNRRRVLRALEIALSSGESKSAQEARQRHHLLYPAIFVGVNYPRDQLYRLIDLRVERMVDDGLFVEASMLKKKYPTAKHAFAAIGYRQIYEGEKQHQTKEEIINAIKKASRNYAKRQMTFFNHQLPMNWFASWQDAYEFIMEKEHRNGIHQD